MGMNRRSVPQGHHAERDSGADDGDGESVDQESHSLLERIIAPRDVTWITLPRRPTILIPIGELGSRFAGT